MINYEVIIVLLIVFAFILLVIYAFYCRFYAPSISTKNANISTISTIPTTIKDISSLNLIKDTNESSTNFGTNYRSTTNSIYKPILNNSEHQSNDSNVYIEPEAPDQIMYGRCKMSSTSRNSIKNSIKNSEHKNRTLICDVTCNRYKQPVGGPCSTDNDCNFNSTCINYICQNDADHRFIDIKDHLGTTVPANVHGAEDDFDSPKTIIDDDNNSMKSMHSNTDNYMDDVGIFSSMIDNMLEVVDKDTCTMLDNHISNPDNKISNPHNNAITTENDNDPKQNDIQKLENDDHLLKNPNINSTTLDGQVDVGTSKKRNVKWSLTNDVFYIPKK